MHANSPTPKLKPAITEFQIRPKSNWPTPKPKGVVKEADPACNKEVGPVCNKELDLVADNRELDPAGNKEFGPVCNRVSGLVEVKESGPVFAPVADSRHHLKNRNRGFL